MLLRYNRLIALMLALIGASISAVPFFFDSQAPLIKIANGASTFDSISPNDNKQPATYRACGDSGCQCIVISSDTCFTLDMLPLAGGATIFCFDACQDRCGSKLRLIFDPSVYGNGGKIPLPPSSSIIFTGDGVVELLNGVEFDMQGTPYCLVPNPPANPHIDWPSIVVQEGAILHLDFQATAAIGGGDSSDPFNNRGAGCVIVRRGGSIQLDEESQLVFGNTYNDDIEVSTEFNGAIIVNHSCAVITFQKACFNVFFDHQSVLNVAQGVVEFNMYRGALTDLVGHVATGVLVKLCIDEGSVFEVLRRGLRSGLIRFAPNFNPDPNFGLGLDIPTDFNNRCGDVCGGGQIQFKEFVNIPVTLVRDLAICQGLTITAGSVLSQTTDFARQTIFVDTELTTDTLIPRGSVLNAGTFVKAGSVINGVPIVVDTSLAVNTTLTIDSILLRLSLLNAGSVIAPFEITGGVVLVVGRLIPQRSKLPAGSVLAVGSELVNTTLNLQLNQFETIATVVNVFMELGYIPVNESTPDGAILVEKGSFNPIFDGMLAALCPPVRNGSQRDGSIVLLQPGDQDVQYNASIGSPVLNQIFGYTFDGRQFVIDNCDESTRSET